MDEGEFGQAAVPHRDYITIGLVGHPNVGKSSLINGIMGKTVVSASRTPGHTKHFQTIHLTENVRLSDCPGLVFPSLLPKPVQVYKRRRKKKYFFFWLQAHRILCPHPDPLWNVQHCTGEGAVLGGAISRRARAAARTARYCPPILARGRGRPAHQVDQNHSRNAQQAASAMDRMGRL